MLLAPQIRCQTAPVTTRVGWRVVARSRAALHAAIGLLVKCGTAACGMRKVKCGMQYAENKRGTVGNLRSAENHTTAYYLCCRFNGRVHAVHSLHTAYEGTFVGP